MSTVTGRINSIKQPYGGYVRPSSFEKIQFDDGITINSHEEKNSNIIGSAVDYLTRFLVGAPIEMAFQISLSGYQECIKNDKSLERTLKKRKIDISSLLEQIKGTDDASIMAACQACAYDVWYRAPLSAIGCDPTYAIPSASPDEITIENIRTMLNRCTKFWAQYGPVTTTGFTFENDGYTKVVTDGDGDYLTRDTLWDFKVSKESKIKSKQTLQLLMYWIMGIHSGKEEFKNIDKLGIFNPKLNIAYLLNTSTISQETINTVEKDVICYE